MIQLIIILIIKQYLKKIKKYKNKLLLKEYKVVIFEIKIYKPFVN